MHIRLTEQELAALVEMVSLAANVASWNNKPSATAKIAAFESMEGKILEKAFHAGMSNWIEFDEETRRFKIRADREEELFYSECYEEFRNESFWDELAIRLADRDVVRAIGQAAWDKLTEEERRERASGMEKRYWEEFTRYGVERIVVMAPPSEG